MHSPGWLRGKWWRTSTNTKVPLPVSMSHWLDRPDESRMYVHLHGQGRGSCVLLLLRLVSQFPSSPSFRSLPGRVVLLLLGGSCLVIDQCNLRVRATRLNVLSIRNALIILSRWSALLMESPYQLRQYCSCLARFHLLTCTSEIVASSAHQPPIFADPFLCPWNSQCCYYESEAP